MDQNQNENANEANNERLRGWNMVPPELWNFRVRNQRAQAGGIRQFVNAPPNRNGRGGGGGGGVEQQNNNRHRGGNQHRAHGRRRDNNNDQHQESSRKDCRTAIELDYREEQCWDRILKDIDRQSINFGPTNNADVYIPTDFDVCSMIRSDDQYETIQNARELIQTTNHTSNSDSHILNCLEKLEMHTRNSAAEYDILENIMNQMMASLGKMDKEMWDLDDLITRVNYLNIQ